MSTKTTTRRHGRIKTGNGCDEPPDPRTILFPPICHGLFEFQFNLFRVCVCGEGECVAVGVASYPSFAQFRAVSVAAASFCNAAKSSPQFVVINANMSCGLRCVLFVACCPRRTCPNLEYEWWQMLQQLCLPECACVCVCLSCISNAFVYLLRINQIASCQFAGFNVTRGLILAIVVCLAV